MAHKHNSIWPVLSLTVIVSLTLSLVAPIPASASPSPQSGGDGLQRNRNAETGKVTLISPSGNGPMAATEALGVTSLSQATNGDTALALAERFAPEFGLQSASENLKQLKVTEAEGGRKAVHYQQTYQGVPVFAGELIVNTDDRGDLYSINGEVSQNLSLSTAPKITSKQAQDTALAATAKWYQKQVSDLTVTDATLMIYDAKLLSPSDRAPELVWKMEVTPLDASEPINELVLVNAQDGKVSLHFNQIDTAFSAKAAGQDPDPTTPTPTDTPPSQPPTASPSTGTPTPAPNDVHPSQPSTDAPSFDNLTPTPMLDVQSQGSEVGILTSDTRYVSTTGADTGDCKTSSSPCLTIQYALNQDSDGSDIIRVAAGTYIRGVGNAINTDPNVVIISRSDTLSGGWNSDFTSQIGYSTIDGEYNVAGDHKNNNGVLVKSSPVVVDRFVIQNSTSWNGGGIYLLAGLTLMNSTVNNNHSGSNGAGIFIDSGGSLTLINSTLSGNIASLGGGGLFNAGSGAVTIQNSTLAYNNGTSSGGGIHPGSGSTVIRNTILAHNTASAGPDCSGTIGTSDHNIFGSISGCTRTSSTGNQTTDPLIDSSLTGSPPVHALLAGSPAIDKGTSTNCPSTDEQGQSRPYDGDFNSIAVCDIGAQEYNPHPGEPAFVTISDGDNQQQTINQSFASPFAVLVKDNLGNPVTGANVTFSAPASGASGTFSSTSSNTETEATNGSGIATSSTFGANSTIGSYSVSVSVGSVASTPSFSLTNTGVSGAPYRIVVDSGSGQAAVINQAFGLPLKAFVTDYFDAPVVGAQVTFTAPLSGASGDFVNTNPVATDSSGIATATTFTANGTLGSYAISASVPGVAATADFALTNANSLWYVDPSQADDSLDCQTPATACKSIAGALGKAGLQDGDVIYVEAGTYTGTGSEVISITKSVSLSGGWDAAFSAQNDFSVIDGQNARDGINLGTANLTVQISRFIVQKSLYGIKNDLGSGSLTFTSGALINNNNGLYNLSGNVNFTNTTISSNHSSGTDGSAINNTSGTVSLQYSTIANNNGSGTPYAIYSLNSSALIQIGNSILANNSGADCYVGTHSGTSNMASGGHNIFGRSPACTTSGSSFVPLASDQHGTDPKLFSLTTAGYHPLDHISTAIDAAGGGCPATDQRGKSRPKGLACDIGAYEFIPAPGVPFSLGMPVSGGDDQQQTINHAFSSPLVAVVTDNLGAAVNGASVAFTAPASGASGTFASTGTNSETVLTNASGSATSSIFTANDTPGAYQVQAAVAGLPGIYIGYSLQNKNLPGIPVSIIVFGEAYQSSVVVPINLTASIPLKVKVLDDYANPVNGASVTFTAPASGASGTFASTSTNSEIIFTTPDGIATSSLLTANNVTGDYIISATVNGVASSADFNLSNITPLAQTFTANHLYNLPGSFLCDQTQTGCTNGADPDADSAEALALAIYNFYFTKFGRTSLDNQNNLIVSTVHYGSIYNNAFWDGSQMVYGDGATFVKADDVVAHELTHGVTQYESNLIYYYQSGAINESLSDVFGEYFDQTNGQGNDSAAVKWLIGEDVQPGGAYISMSNPPLYGDPDKMRSTNYDFDLDFTDNGGVHANAGINNKAAFLMVDGGSFNGKTVTKLGWEKVGAIYYEAQTNLLTTGSDYSDLYYDLYQACQNLAVSNLHGVTLTDCQQVRNATDAVQMSLVPVESPVQTASLCPTGMNTAPSQTIFFDNFENGAGNWNITGNWYLTQQYITTSGASAMWGDDTATNSTSILSMKSDVYLPAGSTPFLYFRHTHAFDHYGSEYYDGGVVEYVVNDSGPVLDVKPLFSAGENYHGTIFKYPAGWEYLGSSLQGRPGFVGNTDWYSASRYNLKSLAGKSVRFFWKFSTDYTVNFGGWLLDDVRIYICAGTPSKPSLLLPANKGLTTDYTPRLDWANSTPALDHYEVQISTNNAFSTLTDGATNLTASEFTPATDLAPNTTYYWRVRAFNALDQTLGWSAVHTFRTALLPPTLVSPTNSEHVLTSRPTFTWNPVSGATGYTVQISKFQNFSSLLTSGTPATATFIPSVNLPANSTLYWRVQTRGVNGPSVWTEIPARSFTTANPPSAPVLASPANNSLSKLYPPVLPLLKWNKSTLPTGSFAYYWVQVATDAAFNNLVVNDNNITDINTIQFPSGTALTANTTYYWRVGAYNQFNPPPNGEYNWSSVFTFRTILDKPALNQFAEGANPLTLRPTFSWGPIAGASKYTVQISKVSNFSSILMSGTPITNSFTPATNLPANTPLFWRVQALGANGPSAWSGTTNYSFNSPNPPNAPLLVSPATGATVTSSTPTLTWSASTLPIPADHYVVEIASNSNFASIVQPSGNISGTTNYTVSPALPSGLYYWRVKAYNASNQYSISATRYFKIP